MNTRYRRLLNLIFFCFGLIAKANAAQMKDTVMTLNIEVKQTAQTIDNIGASGCWFSEGIGKYWPVEKRETIARLLFSRKLDKQGNPQGIGLSAWRFNIGAGTTEQGDSSGIKDFRKRTECFLKPDGTYDWTKQAGYQYFLKKAHDYGVDRLIAFSNSPPVQFTKNGLGYKTEKDRISNLKPDAYSAYAKFLAEVVKHFDARGLHFDYISPVNEPQWDWSHTYKEADQEGSPWTNEEIYKVTQSLDGALQANQSKSRILITEAGMLNYLYQGSGKASHQIQQFFDSKSSLSVKNLNHVPAIIAGHSYFTENNDSTLYAVRKNLADTARKYGVQYWESEYSMLADGYKEGVKGKRSAMDCALFLAKVIHADLTTGNASAWQFWNSYEPGSADEETRYYLIALNPNPDYKDGEFSPTKNLWALGHYSLFIRPGMKRIPIPSMEADSKRRLLVSAWNDNQGELVVVGVNESTGAVPLKLTVTNSGKKYKTLQSYITTADKAMNMKAMPVQANFNHIMIPAKSIVTLVLK